jgi:preprotein translocase subunit SecE
MIAKVRNFFLEVKAEMHKVTWPTREELIGSTGVVLMTMVILSAFIGLTDFIVSMAMTFILR